jgi:hypothetical protein
MTLLYCDVMMFDLSMRTKVMAYDEASLLSHRSLSGCFKIGFKLQSPNLRLGKNRSLFSLHANIH